MGDSRLRRAAARHAGDYARLPRLGERDEGRRTLGAAVKGLELPGHDRVLRADAENIAHQLYSSEQNATRDRAGSAVD